MRGERLDADADADADVRVLDRSLGQRLVYIARVQRRRDEYHDVRVAVETGRERLQARWATVVGAPFAVPLQWRGPGRFGGGGGGVPVGACPVTTAGLSGQPTPNRPSGQQATAASLAGAIAHHRRAEGREEPPCEILVSTRARGRATLAAITPPCQQPEGKEGKEGSEGSSRPGQRNGPTLASWTHDGSSGGARAFLLFCCSVCSAVQLFSARRPRPQDDTTLSLSGLGSGCKIFCSSTTYSRRSRRATTEHLAIHRSIDERECTSQAYTEDQQAAQASSASSTSRVGLSSAERRIYEAYIGSCLQSPLDDLTRLHPTHST